MNPYRIKPVLVTALILLLTAGVVAQEKGMRSITAEELRTHLTFIASDELEGRNTPSTGLKTAARYLATMAESYGLKPVMPDGSFLQEIPIREVSVSEATTRLTVYDPLGERVFYFPQAFGGSFSKAGSVAGELVYAGLGLVSPDSTWDDYLGLDVEGKIVVFLDARLPEDHPLNQGRMRRMLSSRMKARMAQQKGAVAVFNVIDELREEDFVEGGYRFGNEPSAEWVTMQDRRRSSSSIPQIDLRHETSAEILGISLPELRGMFAEITAGRQVPHTVLDEKWAGITVGFERKMSHSQNVVAMVEGSDPELKHEYVLYGAHYDHVGAREGHVWNGADDDGSGTVAMLEMAQAMMLEPPKRSVIFVWHTGEEKGLRGASYFSENSPVPLGKMSAQINMDMISRNDPDGIYAIGAGRLSTELDAIMKEMNERYTKLTIDYTYDAPDDPNRFYQRSDHYMYARFGIPVVFLFCGTTEDYHQPTDTIEKVDFTKMRKVSQLAYLMGYEVGNRPALLPLDADPAVTSRGKHNLEGGR